MNTLFEIHHRQWQLKRFPVQRDVNLQAWDAADEYLLTHLWQQPLSTKMTIHIVNDAFGALACALHQHPLIWQSDSFVSHQACRNNLSANGLSPEISWLNALEVHDTPPDIVLLKIPKSNALLEHQLAQLSQRVHSNTRIIAAGRTRDIHTSTLTLFERTLGPTTTSLARKKARLIFCTPKGCSTLPPNTLSWPLENTPLMIHNHSGVFARNQLDIGARLMLSAMPTKGDYRDIIDLGCGNGVLGLQAACHFPDATLTLVDESHMAVESARLTLTHNLPGRQRLNFLWNNCLDGVPPDSADLVLCNPPFHQLQTVTDHIAWQMFHDAHRVLRRNGQLHIVGNRHLGYHAKLKRLFGNCETVVSNNKFVILSATKV